MRACVAASWGADLGYTWDRAICCPPPPRVRAAPTLATPPSRETASRTRAKVAASVGAEMRAVTWRGPLNPGPKPFASRS